MKMLLGDLVEVISGFAFKSEMFSSDSGVPLIRIRDVLRGYTETFYTGDFDSKYLVTKGDILVGMDGEFNSAEWTGINSLLNQRVCKIVPDETRLDRRYLLHFLPRQLKAIEDVTSFVTVKHLSVKDIRGIEVSLPPLEEQKRIAAILDKVDSLRRKRAQAIALADDFLRATFLDLFGDPVTNPKGLPQKSLGELIKLKSGDFLPAQQMASDGEFFVYGGNGINGLHDEFMFSESRIVIGRVGAYCGAVHVTEPRSWVTDNALFVADFSDELQFEYLAFALKFANLNQYASRSGQPLISAGRLNPVLITIPDKCEQIKFVAIKNALEQIGGKLSANNLETDSLKKSLAVSFFG